MLGSVGFMGWTCCLEDVVADGVSTGIMSIFSSRGMGTLEKVAKGA